MKVSKYKWKLTAVKNLRHGQGILFNLEKTWGLASIIYRKGLHKELDLNLTINLTAGTLKVVREPDILIWED